MHPQFQIGINGNKYLKSKGVDNVKDYTIPFKGLRLGEHPFEWELNKKFFENADYSEILDCDLLINLILDKKERMMELYFRINGRISVQCDRCLGPLELPVDITEDYFVKIGAEREEESEEVLVIPESDYEIDVAPLIFDYVLLSVPIKKVHKHKSDCDQEMLKKLEELKGGQSTDPRWDALKNIKL
ncbi:MAG: DUF177 domain-containing protein [Bacteroidales bacterium]|nr:DUF177 domain-containing protein [Bacteroidales bacterium]